MTRDDDAEVARLVALARQARVGRSGPDADRAALAAIGLGATAPAAVYVVVTWPDAEAAMAARIAEVQVFTECTGPVDDATDAGEPMTAYRCQVNGPPATVPLQDEDQAGQGPHP